MYGYFICISQGYFIHTSLPTPVFAMKNIIWCFLQYHLVLKFQRVEVQELTLLYPYCCCLLMSFPRAT